jgi:arsenate reductase-like glutaredoxin family protein
MPDEPRKIFDLMDTETEPTDEQLAELMHYVGEAVRAKKRAAGLQVRELNGSVRESASSPYGT